MQQDAAKEIIQPAPEQLEELISSYKRHGMDIVPVDGVLPPEEMRRVLKIKPTDFAVCAFMGFSKPRKSHGFEELARLYTESILKIDINYKAGLPLITGGGNSTLKSLSEQGSMSWSASAYRKVKGSFARFVTMQNLINKEGIEPTNGVTIAIRQAALQERIGERGDGLIGPASCFVNFPGGVGTDAELFALNTSTAIGCKAGRKSLVIVDPMTTDPQTGDTLPFWNFLMRHMVHQNNTGYITDLAAQNMNAHSIRYMPPEGTSVKVMAEEVVSLTLAAQKLNGQMGLAANVHPFPIPHQWQADHIKPIKSGAKLLPIFPRHPSSNNWPDRISKLVGVSL